MFTISQEVHIKLIISKFQSLFISDTEAEWIYFPILLSKISKTLHEYILQFISHITCGDIGLGEIFSHWIHRVSISFCIQQAQQGYCKVQWMFSSHPVGFGLSFPPFLIFSFSKYLLWSPMKSGAMENICKGGQFLKRWKYLVSASFIHCV